MRKTILALLLTLAALATNAAPFDLGVMGPNWRRLAICNLPEGTPIRERPSAKSGILEGTGGFYGPSPIIWSDDNWFCVVDNGKNGREKGYISVNDCEVANPTPITPKAFPANENLFWVKDGRRLMMMDRNEMDDSVIFRIGLLTEGGVIVCPFELECPIVRVIESGTPDITRNGQYDYTLTVTPQQYSENGLDIRKFGTLLNKIWEEAYYGDELVFYGYDGKMLRTHATASF